MRRNPLMKEHRGQGTSRTDAFLQEERMGRRPEGVAEIIKEYGDGKIISYEGFKKFMIHIFGDTDSKEDVLAGWNLIAKGEAVVKDEAMDVILGAEDIAYIKETAPQKDGGYDYTAWTEDVFSR